MCMSHPAVSTVLQPPFSITKRATATTTVSVSWSQVSGATGYYVSYQRQDFGAPPVVTPQYERIVGGATTSVTLSGLELGTTYRNRVWSTDGTTVSSGAMEVDVTTMESGELFVLWSKQSEKTRTIVLHENLCMFKCWSNLPNFSNCPHAFTHCYSHSLLPTTHADHDWSTNWE